MTKSFPLLILLLAGTLLFSCKKYSIVHKSEFDKSYQTWTSFKASSNNSYRYQVKTFSWTGYNTETIITVREGKVVKREYIAKTVKGGPVPQVTIHEEWVEDEKTLNSHQNGAATITLDEIYQLAKSDYLKKRKDADVSFERKNNGMISSAGYVDKNCQDDCFRGIGIAFIEKL